MSTSPLRLYNTLTRAKEDFRPLDPARVRMYVCGPTVYDFAHIGNARPLIVFDVLYRLLRHIYGAGRVTYVRNITDVDDKINARAAERGITIRELTEGTNAIFQEDARALGCLDPDVQPRATEHIAEMITIIERLIAAGHAYAADGHALFSVPSMADYGALSRRPLDEMIAGARVDVAPYKKGEMDFVLWKPSSESEPGWDSPWGRGRPGWHIECSAMSWRHLGETFDIHGGGIDLVFPHHENEIAQSRCAFGRDVMANVWMHNGFLQVEGQKMSKSLGNFITIRDVLADWPGEVARLNMLKTHYRQPIDWTAAALRESKRELDKWYPVALQYAGAEAMLSPEFEAALCDDLNTPDAITHLRRLYSEAQAGVAFAGARLHACGALLGLFQHDLGAWNGWRPASAGIDELAVQRLINARLAARAQKNWAESDRIRDELAAMGVQLKDGKDANGAPPTHWEVKR
ncbi:MAG: cysteine--tRNA ligase [Beijerinckiaceae bacterium]